MKHSGLGIGNLREEGAKLVGKTGSDALHEWRSQSVFRRKFDFFLVSIHRYENYVQHEQVRQKQPPSAAPAAVSAGRTRPARAGSRTPLGSFPPSKASRASPTAMRPLHAHDTRKIKGGARPRESKGSSFFRVYATGRAWWWRGKGDGSGAARLAARILSAIP